MSGVELYEVSVSFGIVPTVSSLAHSLVIEIILSFLFHVTLVPIVVNLTSGLDECFESVHSAAVSEQFVLDKVLQTFAICVTKRLISPFYAGKVALKVPGVSGCQPFLAKRLYGSFRFLTFVHDSEVGFDFCDKSFPSVEDFDGGVFCFSFVDDLILITPHKVVLKEPFDPVQGFSFEQRDCPKDLFSLGSKAVSIELDVQS